MQLTSILLSLLAASASADPSGKSCPAKPPVRKFGIQAVRPNTPIHYGLVSAWNGQFYIAPSSDKFDAKCESGDGTIAATFYVKDGGLFLHGSKDRVQQAYVHWPRPNLVPFGATNFGYTDGVETPNPNLADMGGWALSGENVLTYGGKRLLACPVRPAGEDYAVWVHQGEDDGEDGESGCFVFVGKTLDHGEDAEKCYYSHPMDGIEDSE